MINKHHCSMLACGHIVVAEPLWEGCLLSLHGLVVPTAEQSVIDEGVVACCKAKTKVQITHRGRSGDCSDPWRTCSTAPH